jgi:hypothetical protein
MYHSEVIATKEKLFVLRIWEENTRRIVYESSPKSSIDRARAAALEFAYSGPNVSSGKKRTPTADRVLDISLHTIPETRG